MTRQLSRALVLLGGWLAAASPTAAQYPYPPPGYQPGGASGTPARPPLSPYLNIVNGPGANPAVNYYNFARPALQAQQYYQQQQSAGLPLPLTEPFGLASAPPLGLDPSSRMPRPTGHPAAFMNTSGYFNSMGSIGGPPARGAGPTGARTPAPAPARR
jgi:hypothetical protein